MRFIVRIEQRVRQSVSAIHPGEHGCVADLNGRASVVQLAAGPGLG